MAQSRAQTELLEVETVNRDAVIRASPESNILKSLSDKRLYRGLKLPNGLQVNTLMSLHLCFVYIDIKIGAIN